jgi:hypothetical protein
MADKMKRVYRTAESLQPKNGGTLTPSHTCQNYYVLMLSCTHERTVYCTDNNRRKNNDSRIGGAVCLSMLGCCSWRKFERQRALPSINSSGRAFHRRGDLPVLTQKILYFHLHQNRLFGIQKSSEIN